MLDACYCNRPDIFTAHTRACAERWRRENPVGRSRNVQYGEDPDARFLRAAGACECADGKCRSCQPPPPLEVLR